MKCGKRLAGALRLSCSSERGYIRKQLPGHRRLKNPATGSTGVLTKASGSFGREASVYDCQQRGPQRLQVSSQYILGPSRGYHNHHEVGGYVCTRKLHGAFGS